MKTLKIDASIGFNFDDVAAKAKKIAIEKGVTVEFEFNGKTCLVNGSTNLDWFKRDYSNSWTMEWETVGPDCVEKYSKEVEEEFKKKKQAADERRDKEEAEYRKKQDKERLEFEAQIAGEKLELADVDGWNKSRSVNSDGYGKAALDYAEGWAKLMQIEISKGKTVTECYDYTQNGLGFLGITGFQFGCAVSILSQTWVHGKELKIAHNRSYGVSDEVSGTVNPAVLSIGK